jgi:hypothetical protein
MPTTAAVIAATGTVKDNPLTPENLSATTCVRTI